MKMEINLFFGFFQICGIDFDQSEAFNSMHLHLLLIGGWHSTYYSYQLIESNKYDISVPDPNIDQVLNRWSFQDVKRKPRNQVFHKWNELLNPEKIQRLASTKRCP